MRADVFHVRNYYVLRMRRWARFLLVIGVLYVICCWLVLERKFRHSWHKRGGCTDDESVAFLTSLCKDYLNGMVGGSLCEPLCVKKEVKFIKCLGHGVKMTEHVSNLSSVGLHLNWFIDRHRLIPKEEFVHKANMSLYLNVAGRRHVANTLSTIERIFGECDLLEDGQLSYNEAMICWSLIETDELILLSILNGISSIPDVYGTCGNMYAIQYATSQPLLPWIPTITDNRSWSFRAKLAIALIEMVYSLEMTPYGTLYLCDVKEANFGLVKHPHTNRLVGKTIDLDLSWFEQSLMEHRKLKYCERDDDCRYVDCTIRCNLKTHTCSGSLITNNLQVLCTNVLTSHNWISGLLRDPPTSVRDELTATLDQCTLSTSLPQPHININIMNKLLSLLHQS